MTKERIKEIIGMTCDFKNYFDKKNISEIAFNLYVSEDRHYCNLEFFRNLGIVSDENNALIKTIACMKNRFFIEANHPVEQSDRYEEINDLLRELIEERYTYDLGGQIYDFAAFIYFIEYDDGSLNLSVQGLELVHKEVIPKAVMEIRSLINEVKEETKTAIKLIKKESEKTKKNTKKNIRTIKKQTESVVEKANNFHKEIIAIISIIFAVIPILTFNISVFNAQPENLIIALISVNVCIMFSYVTLFMIISNVIFKTPSVLLNVLFFICLAAILIIIFLQLYQPVVIETIYKIISSHK